MQIGLWLKSTQKNHFSQETWWKCTLALKTNTSLLPLAAAKVRIKANIFVISAKGRLHKPPQNYHEIPSGCFPVLERALNGKIAD